MQRRRIVHPEEGDDAHQLRAASFNHFTLEDMDFGTHLEKQKDIEDPPEDHGARQCGEHLRAVFITKTAVRGDERRRLRETKGAKAGRGGGEKVDCFDEWCGKGDEEAAHRKRSWSLSVWEGEGRTRG